MIQNAQDKIVNWLNSNDSSMLFEQKRQNLYNKLKEEIISNINEFGNYPDAYKYLLDLRLFFSEINKGFFTKTELQLSIDFFNDDIIKKTNLQKLQ